MLNLRVFINFQGELFHNVILQRVFGDIANNGSWRAETNSKVHQAPSWCPGNFVILDNYFAGTEYSTCCLIENSVIIRLTACDLSR